MNDKKAKYQKKEITFGGKKHLLWSIDGNTWSTRKDELLAIQERHENEKITFGEIKGIAPKKFPPRRALQAADTEPIEKANSDYSMDADVEFASESDDGGEETQDASHKRTGKSPGKSAKSQAPVLKAEKQKKDAPKKAENKKPASKEKNKKNLPAKAAANKKAVSKRKPAVASPKKRPSSGPKQATKAAKSKAAAGKSGKKAA